MQNNIQPLPPTIYSQISTVSKLADDIRSPIQSERRRSTKQSIGVETKNIPSSNDDKKLIQVEQSATGRVMIYSSLMT